MGKIESFFGRSQSQAALNNVHLRISALPSGTDFENARNSYILLITDSMRSSPPQWDMQCAISIGWIGDQFINRFADKSEALSKQNLDDIFSMCFRFLFELYLSMKNDLSHDFERACGFATEHLTEFERSARDQIEFALRDMPIGILKSLLNNEQVQSVKHFNELAQIAEEKIKQWNLDLESREDRVNEIKLNLEKYKNAFNFVGLSNGFDKLSTIKEKEKKWNLFWLIIMGLLIVAPIMLEILFIKQNIATLDTLSTKALLITAVPTLSIVAILIYYFRVLLHNFNALRSQILQIELRKTLCGFIQNYAEYSKEIREKNSNTLSKFENFIFSGLVSTDEKLPSTFDGLEQLVSFIKSIRKD